MRATVDDLLATRTRYSSVAPNIRPTVIRSYIAILGELEPDLVLEADDRAAWRISARALQGYMDGSQQMSKPEKNVCMDALEDLARKGWRGPATGHVRPLPFVRDPILRKIAERDLTSLGGALKSEEAKTCLVLAGSVMEAVLLDVIEADPAAAAGALRRAREAAATRARWRDAAPVEWDLWQMIEVAGPGGLGFLSANTVTIARTVKDMRNVVHPGRERREGSSVTTADAHVAEALTLKVLEEISTRAPVDQGAP